jgi:hypothetical protein
LGCILSACVRRGYCFHAFFIVLFLVSEHASPCSLSLHACLGSVLRVWLARALRPKSIWVIYEKKPF